MKSQYWVTHSNDYENPDGYIACYCPDEKPESIVILGEFSTLPKALKFLDSVEKGSWVSHDTYINGLVALASSRSDVVSLGRTITAMLSFQKELQESLANAKAFADSLAAEKELLKAKIDNVEPKAAPSLSLPLMDFIPPAGHNGLGYGKN